MALRRMIRVLICLACLIALSIGCAPANENDAPPDLNAGWAEPVFSEPVSLTWHTETMNETRLAAFRAHILDPLRTSMPTVSISHIPATSDNWEKTLSVLLVSGQSPDLFTAPNPLNDASQYGPRGLLYDMSDYAALYDWTNRLYTWALDAGRTEDGALYLAPLSCDGVLLWYNENLLQQISVPLPTNLNSLTQAANSAGQAGLVPFAFKDEAISYELLFSALVVNYCGAESTRDMLEGRKSFSSTDFAAAIDTMTQMVRAGWMTDMYAHRGISGLELFTSQKALIYLGGANTLGLLPEPSLSPFAYQADIFPPLHEDAAAMLPVSVNMSVGIGAKSTHPDEAAAVINALYSDERAMVQAVDSYLIQSPPYAVDTSLFEDNDMRARLFTLLAASQADPALGYCSWSFWPAPVRTYIMAHINDVFEGKQSTEAFVQELDRIERGTT